METFGKRLARLRKLKRINRPQLAELLGMDSETIARYERGEREPKLSDAAKIADILSVSIDYLYSGAASSDANFINENDSLAVPVIDTDFLHNIPGRDFIISSHRRIHIPKSFMGYIDTSNPPFAFVINDDSFAEMSVRAGSFVIINPAEKVHDFDAAYIFYRGVLALKRLQHAKDGSVLLLSATTRDAVKVPLEDACDAFLFKVIGKAVAYKFEEVKKFLHKI